MKRSNSGERQQVMMVFTEPDDFVYLLWCHKVKLDSGLLSPLGAIHLGRGEQSNHTWLRWTETFSRKCSVWSQMNCGVFLVFLEMCTLTSQIYDKNYVIRWYLPYVRWECYCFFLKTKTAVHDHLYCQNIYIYIFQYDVLLCNEQHLDI